MHTSAAPPIHPRRHDSLLVLLSTIGPYRRDQLRLRLLSAARTCLDEAAALRRSRAAFASRTGLPLSVLPLPSTSLPTSPEGWETEAAVYEQMAEVVRAYRPDFSAVR